jgi:hypothetical protein
MSSVSMKRRRVGRIGACLEYWPCMILFSALHKGQEYKKLIEINYVINMKYRIILQFTKMQFCF